MQNFVVAHGTQSMPPQSTSVSPLFLAPSEHDAGAWQTLLLHWPLWQSPALLQDFPAGHFSHAPPQSTSLSSPSFFPLLQVVSVPPSGFTPPSPPPPPG